MKQTLPPHETPRRLAISIGAFTLVELLIGVVFVSIVLALAVPRFWNAGSEARAARQQAIYGSLRAAAQITHAAARVHNQLGPQGTVEVDGMRISTVYGYPSATPAGIIAATGLDTTSNQFTLSEGGTLAGNSITIALRGARSACAIVYTAPSGADAQPRIDRVSSVSSGEPAC